MARRSTVKTLQGFDFSFQPPLDRGRILALARLAFLERNGVVHLLGPPGTGKSHPAIALGVAAVRAGRSVYFSPLAAIVGSPARPPARPRRAGGGPARAHPLPVPGVAADRGRSIRGAIEGYLPGTPSKVASAFVVEIR